MPRVPTYSEPQVRQQALQPVFQNVPDVSSGAQALAQGVSAIGDAAQRIDLRATEVAAKAAEKARVEAMRAASVRADALLNDTNTEWDAWENENRGKYTGTKHGGYAEAAREWWAKKHADLDAKTDPLVKAAATRDMGRYRTVAVDQAMKYERGERQRFDDGVYLSVLNTGLTRALKTGDYEIEAQAARDAVSRHAAANNWSKEQRDAEVNTRLGFFHSAIVNQLSARDAMGAQKYLDGAVSRQEVPPSQVPELQRTIGGEADNQFARVEAVRIRALPPEQQKAALAAIDSPNRLDKTQQRIHVLEAVDKAQYAAREKQASDAAWQLVGQGRRVPEALLGTMDGRERVQLQEHVRRRNEREAKGEKAVKTDPITLARILDMARDDKESFKKLRMESLTELVSGSDMEQVARLQRDMNKPDKEREVANTMQLLGTYTGGFKPEKRSAFSQAFLDELNTFEKDKKRPASYEEKRKIGDRMMLDGEVLSGKFYLNDPNKKYYEATPEERQRFRPLVSPNDKKLIIDALQKEGVLKPSDEQITARFKLAKGMQ